MPASDAAALFRRRICRNAMQWLRQLPDATRDIRRHCARAKIFVLRVPHSRKTWFGFGLNHVVDVLCGADTDPIRQRGHDRLSTYGIGQDLKRSAWQAIGRELLRL